MALAQPAWQIPTGQQMIITAAGRPLPQPNRPTRHLVYSAIALGGLSAASWFAYSHLGWERLVTLGQMCALLAGVCIIAVCHLRAQREQHRADLARVHLHIRDALAEGVHAIHDLGTLRGELRDQKTAITAVMEHLQRIEPGAEFRQRLDAVERQVGDLDGRVGSAATALGIIAAAEGGSVRPLHPPNGLRRR